MMSALITENQNANNIDLIFQYLVKRIHLAALIDIIRISVQVTYLNRGKGD